jgi:chromosome condensin MukBEF ATPase and DNA-binding subunit MukB
VAVLAALHLADRARQLENEIERLNQRAGTLDERLSEILSNK